MSLSARWNWRTSLTDRADGLEQAILSGPQKTLKTCCAVGSLCYPSPSVSLMGKRNELIRRDREPTPTRGGNDGRATQHAARFMAGSLLIFMPVKTFRPLTPSTRYIAIAYTSGVQKTHQE